MSKLVCVDTNVFIRLFTQDDPQQTRAALTLIQAAEAGEFTLVINDLIVTEIAWVLRRAYKLPPDAVRNRVLATVQMPFIDVRPADLTTQIANAFDLFVTQNIDFTDAYIASWMASQNLSVIYTFNRKHFARVPGIEALLPDTNN